MAVAACVLTLLLSQDLESGEKLFELEHEVRLFIVRRLAERQTGLLPDDVNTWGHGVYAMLRGALNRPQELPIENLDLHALCEEKRCCER